MPLSILELRLQYHWSRIPIMKLRQSTATAKGKNRLVGFGRLAAAEEMGKAIEHGMAWPMLITADDLDGFLLESALPAFHLLFTIVIIHQLCPIKMGICHFSQLMGLLEVRRRPHGKIQSNIAGQCRTPKE